MLKHTHQPRRPGRKRRFAGRTLLVLGPFLAALWFASGWYSAHIGLYWEDADTGKRSSNGVIVECRYGLVALTSYRRMDGVSGWIGVERPRDTPAWVWSGWRLAAPPSTPRTSSWWQMQLPLWSPAVASLVGGSLLLKWGRSARWRTTSPQCPACGYSRAGLVDTAVCPECGLGTSEP